MKYGIVIGLLLIIVGCAGQKEASHHFGSVAIEEVYADSTSIRAIEVIGHSLAFAGSRGAFGTVDVQSQHVRANVQVHDSIRPEFRSIAHTATDFFMLSVANPALLYKTGNSGSMELVYQETGDSVFYDAMRFWNNREGLAIGDSQNGCLSMIITRDGGSTWTKVPCNVLPPAQKGEGAFAASNTNIVTQGDQAWVATTEGKVLYTADKGLSWTAVQTPMIHQEATQGIYSLDFYDGKLGFVIGGDYTKPAANKANKAITKDGGKTWALVADGSGPGYKSCVQFVPHSGGNDLVAIGFTGISYSQDRGETWKTLSQEGFYTIRFVSDSVAYAAGHGRIARLVFQK